MQILDIVRSAQGGQLASNLGRQFGLTPEQTDAVLASVLPQLSAGIERNTLSRGGLADLVKALGHGHHAETLDDPRALARPDVAADGTDILGHILGSKDSSRAVAARAAGSTGISEGIIKMMLPILASILMGGLSKGLGGGLGDILGKMGGGPPQSGGAPSGFPRRQSSPNPSQGEGGFDLPQMPSGGGMGIPMPDGRRENTGGNSGQWGSQSGDLRGGQAFPRGGSPLPLPGESVPGVQGNADNPFGDLADIIRRGPSRGGTFGGGQGGGLPAPGLGGGGGLWGLVRGLLGGALGFGNRGVMGWILNLIIMRFGWPLLRTILGKVMLGR
jgi:hypothetical protein